MTYKIVSDSSCDLDINYIKTNDIDIIPFYVTLDGKNYLKDSVEISSSEITDFMKNNPKLFTKTSQPNPLDYKEVFEKIAKENKDILCFTISSKLSGSNQSAHIAKAIIEEDYDIKIKIIDTKTGTLAHGIMIDKALKLKDEGLSIEDTFDYIEKIKDSSKTYILFDTLKYLEKGGRVSKSKMIVGEFLNLKPIILLKDHKLEIIDKVVGKKRAIDKLISLIKKDLSDHSSKYDLFIVHSGSNEVQEIFDNFKNIINIPFPIRYISPVFVSHAGPGAIAVGIVKTKI